MPGHRPRPLDGPTDSRTSVTHGRPIPRPRDTLDSPLYPPCTYHRQMAGQTDPQTARAADVLHLPGPLLVGPLTGLTLVLFS